MVREICIHFIKGWKSNVQHFRFCRLTGQYRQHCIYTHSTNSLVSYCFIAAKFSLVSECPAK